ncbi:MAG: hypothetical protein K8S97_03485, partial [Anaerolineae bacterium]|nr:hypothetical protein [Anaerolineae bacterium]
MSDYDPLPQRPRRRGPSDDLPPRPPRRTEALPAGPPTQVNLPRRPMYPPPAAPRKFSLLLISAGVVFIVLLMIGGVLLVWTRYSYTNETRVITATPLTPPAVAIVGDGQALGLGFITRDSTGN